MISTHHKPTFDVIANATRLWSTRLEQPCLAITSMVVLDQTVRSGP